ncbi:MAG: hypothetical protein AB8B83_07940 [Bdellovibrionales bacterium]
MLTLNGIGRNTFFMNGWKLHIHALLIAAIVMVGVSPACAFILGGQSYIEICASDGSIQTIEVDESLDPFAERLPLSPEHLEHMEQCAFCFAGAHMHFVPVDYQNLQIGQLFNYLKISSGTTVPLGSELIHYHSRGPPLLS